MINREPGTVILSRALYLSFLRFVFRYNPYEQGDLILVEEADVEKIEALARESWGKNYTWV